MHEAELLEYARRLADDLEKDMTWVVGGLNGSYWSHVEESGRALILARTTAALEFFRKYCGTDSTWTLRAIQVSEKARATDAARARPLGGYLREWASQVEAGVIEIAGLAASAEIGIASTDLMTQVRRLLEEKNAHPAAAIVLCGAALEIALRATVDAKSLQLTERPSMGAYYRLLRQERFLTAQDVKDFDQCAGLRNSAAHGEFEGLSKERAGLMEQQTNLLLRKLADLLE